MTEEPRRRRRDSAAMLPSPQAEREAPNSKEGEEGVLGCLLLDPKYIGMAVEKFSKGTEVFYDFRLQALFDALIEMSEKEMPIEPFTVGQWLKDRKQLDAIGGMPFLAALMNSVPSAASLEYYADIVWEKYTLRKLVQTCTAAVAKVYASEANVEELVAEVQRDVNAACEPPAPKKDLSIGTLVNKAITQIEEAQNSQGKPMGLSTGFPDLDKMTSGFQNGDLIVIAARPSQGKTSLAMNIAEHIALELREPVGFFSMEMTAEALVLRALCSRANINLRNVRDGFLSESDYPRLTAAAGKLTSSPIYIDDTPALTLPRWKAKARAMRAKNGIKFFVVDYFQLMTSGAKKFETTQQDLSIVSAGVKELAKELDLPILLLAQLNRETEKGEKHQRPRLSNIKGTGSLEQDGDLIMLLCSTEKKEDEDESDEIIPTDLIVAKQRNGPTGTVKLGFQKCFTKFVSIAKTVDPQDMPRHWQDSK